MQTVVYNGKVIPYFESRLDMARNLDKIYKGKDYAAHRDNVLSSRAKQNDMYALGFKKSSPAEPFNPFEWNKLCSTWAWEFLNGRVYIVSRVNKDLILKQIDSQTWIDQEGKEWVLVERDGCYIPQPAPEKKENLLGKTSIKPMGVVGIIILIIILFIVLAITSTVISGAIVAIIHAKDKANSAKVYSTPDGGQVYVMPDGSSYKVDKDGKVTPMSGPGGPWAQLGALGGFLQNVGKIAIIGIGAVVLIFFLPTIIRKGKTTYRALRRR